TDDPGASEPRKTLSSHKSGKPYIPLKDVIADPIGLVCSTIRSNPIRSSARHKHRPLVTFTEKNLGCFVQSFKALVECQITEEQGHLLFFIEAEGELRRFCIQSWQVTRNSQRQHGNLGPKRRGVSL